MGTHDLNDYRQTLFGFGSLMEPDSLKASAPDACNLRPSYIVGFVRDFNLWDEVGFTETNLDVGGQPFCALNVRGTGKSDSRVNGVTFQVSTEGLKQLRRREAAYKIVETAAFDFYTHKFIDECFLFSAHKNSGVFDFGSPAQMRYLSLCLRGARHYGEDFYKEFLRTTLIGGKPLREFPSLLGP